MAMVLALDFTVILWIRGLSFRQYVEAFDPVAGTTYFVMAEEIRGTAVLTSSVPNSGSCLSRFFQLNVRSLESLAPRPKSGKVVFALFIVRDGRPLSEVGLRYVRITPTQPVADE